MPMNDALRAMSYGEKMVGINFNPSGDEKVAKLKEAFASIIDMCADELADLDNENEATPIWREAIMRSLDAQMWTVKAATWRR